MAKPLAFVIIRLNWARASEMSEAMRRALDALIESDGAGYEPLSVSATGDGVVVLAKLVQDRTRR